MNLAGVTSRYFKEIKEQLRGSSTVFITNLDYAPECIDTASAWTQNVQEFYEAFMAVDFCFAQVPFQQSLLQVIWRDACNRKEKIPIVPHPVDTSLKKLYVQPDDRVDSTAVMWHRYDGHLLIPSILTRSTPVKGTLGEIEVRVPSILFGYVNRNIDLSTFDVITARRKWDQYIYLLSHCTVGLSYYTVSSQDRFCAETACLGIPTVTTNRSYFGQLFFPKFSFPPEQLDEMRHSLNRLRMDAKLWEQAKDYAWKKVEDYGLKESANRLLRAIRSWGFKV